MGCGCRGSNKKLSAKRKALIREKSKSKLDSKQKLKRANKIKNKIINSRLSACKSCSYSIQNKRDKKYNLHLCHKMNRPIGIIATDFSFFCPIGKFPAAQ